MSVAFLSYIPLTFEIVIFRRKIIIFSHFREGRVFRLIFKSFYERHCPNEHDPEIRRAPLDKIVLDTKMLDMGEPKEILALALDPPDLRNIKR